MLNQLFAKVLDQSLDELLKKNVCISVPLSANKIENTIKSIFGENRYVVDLSNNVKEVDFAAGFMNLKNDSVVLIKNINNANDEFVLILTHILSKRQIPIVIDQNGEDKLLHIDIADCYFIALMNEGEFINYPLSEYFNIKIQLSSSDLPEPTEVNVVDSDTDSEENSTELENVDSETSNYFTVVWHIDNAVFEFEEKSDLKKWKKAGKTIQFEFDPTNSDDGGNAIFADVDSAIKFFDLDDDNSTLNISEDGTQISVSAWVKFNVELNSDISEDEFNEWAYENGGVSCGTINLKDIDATIISDEGQELRLEPPTETTETDAEEINDNLSTNVDKATFIVNLKNGDSGEQVEHSLNCSLNSKAKKVLNRFEQNLSIKEFEKLIVKLINIAEFKTNFAAGAWKVSREKLGWSETAIEFRGIDTNNIKYSVSFDDSGFDEFNEQTELQLYEEDGLPSVYFINNTNTYDEELSDISHNEGLPIYISINGNAVKYAVSYLVEQAENSQELLGAYYGYVGGGENDGGYFIYNVEKSKVEHFDFEGLEKLATKKPDRASKLESVMQQIWQYIENDDGELNLTDFGKLKIQADDDGIWIANEFDGDFLDTVSKKWKINLKFES